MKYIAKLTAALLILLTLVTTVPFTAFAAGLGDYTVGQTIEYGSYPQTRVKDTKLLKTLETALTKKINKKKVKWSKMDLVNSGSAQKLTRYIDITIGGVRYRVVKLVDLYVNEAASQSRNGYRTAKNYWFVYEPVKWTVADSKGLCVSELVIDARPWAEKANTEINEWLNSTFLENAFTSKILIKKVTVDGKLRSVQLPTEKTLGDSVKCLSTDYAKCMGVNRRASWFKNHRYSAYFTQTGTVVTKQGKLDKVPTFSGVRPAFYLSKGATSETPVGGSEVVVKKYATVKASGKVSKVCSYCNENETVTIPKIGKCSIKNMTLGTKGKPKASILDANGEKIDAKYYTVSYPENYATAGNHNATVKFKGYYKGTMTLSYNVLPEKVQTDSAEPGKTSVKLKWFKTDSVSGYTVYSYNKKTKEYKKVLSTKKNVCTIEDLQPGTEYTFYVRGFIKVSGKAYYSEEYSAFTFKTTGKKPAVTTTASESSTELSTENAKNAETTTLKDGKKETDASKIGKSEVTTAKAKKTVTTTKAAKIDSAVTEKANETTTKKQTSATTTKKSAETTTAKQTAATTTRKAAETTTAKQTAATTTRKTAETTTRKK